jgi:putative chitinase
VDFTAQPELLAQPYYAAMSAAWFWASHGLNEVADTGDFEKTTKIINGGLNG